MNLSHKNCKTLIFLGKRCYKSHKFASFLTYDGSKQLNWYWNAGRELSANSNFFHFHLIFFCISFDLEWFLWNFKDTKYKKWLHLCRFDFTFQTLYSITNVQKKNVKSSRCEAKSLNSQCFEFSTAWFPIRHRKWKIHWMQYNRFRSLSRSEMYAKWASAFIVWDHVIEHFMLLVLTLNIYSKLILNWICLAFKIQELFIYSVLSLQSAKIRQF